MESPTGSPGTVTRPRSETPGGTGSLPGTTAGEFYCDNTADNTAGQTDGIRTD